MILDDAAGAHSIAGNDHQHSIFFHPNGGADQSTASANPGGDALHGANTTGNPTTVPAASVPVIHVPVGVQGEVQTQPVTSK